MARLFFQSYGPKPAHLPKTIHSSLVVFCTNSRTYSWIHMGKMGIYHLICPGCIPMSLHNYLFSLLIFIQFFHCYTSGYFLIEWQTKLYKYLPCYILHISHIITKNIKTIQITWISDWWYCLPPEKIYICFQQATKLGTDLNPIKDWGDLKAWLQLFVRADLFWVHP